MTSDEAIEALEKRLSGKPKLLEGFNQRNGEDRTPEQLANDLVEWFNDTDLTPQDIRRFVKLLDVGEFDAWNCPTCNDGTRVYLGTPEDWSRFQGVQNADYVSYPGYNIGPDDKRCDHCRMTKEGEGYIPEGYSFCSDS